MFLHEILGDEYDKGTCFYALQRYLNERYNQKTVNCYKP